MLWKTFQEQEDYLLLARKKEQEVLEVMKKVRRQLDYVRKWDKIELEKYKKIIEYMSESVWIWDEKERTTYANPNFCKLLWYSLDEMIGRESYDFRDEESVKTVADNNERRSEWQASKYEWVLKAKDGTLIPVLCSWTPIPGGTVWIMTDLREVKTLQKAKEELKDINKMKDEFISIVWHELRTPLTIIKGYLSMILEWDMWNINLQVKESINQSFESTISLIGIVNNMLDLSKIDSGKMFYLDEKVDMLELSNKLYNDLKIIADEKHIHFELNKKWIFKNKIIKIDPNKFKQIIINLVNNAFKFTNKWWLVKINLIDEEKSIRFEVEDSWIGINKTQLEKIFHKFYQIDVALKRNTEWLWLGLSIIEWIIHHYNSQIYVESEVGKGTKFYFALNKYL